MNPSQSRCCQRSVWCRLFLSGSALQQTNTRVCASKGREDAASTAKGLHSLCAAHPRIKQCMDPTATPGRTEQTTHTHTAQLLLRLLWILDPFPFTGSRSNGHPITQTNVSGFASTLIPLTHQGLRDLCSLLTLLFLFCIGQ